MPAEPATGRWPGARLIVWAATAGTVAFVVASAVTAAWPETFIAFGVGVSLALFVLGCAAFALAYARAVSRSRYDQLDLPGLFFLQHSVERRAQVVLLGALAVQVVAGVAAAAVRPFTPLAFGTLAPTFGLGLAALYGATHGRFAARVIDEGDLRRNRRRRGGSGPPRSGRGPGVRR